MARAVSFDERKFSELMLYIALKSETDPKYGATKLNKILFYSDFGAFLSYGAAITGATYQKLPHGPAPRQLLPVKNKMIASNDIVERVSSLGNNMTQKRIIALRDPDLSIFSAQEIAYVDHVLKSFLPLNATEVSDFSHKMTGWRLAGLNEDIPYFTACIPDGTIELSAEHIEYGLNVASRINATA